MIASKSFSANWINDQRARFPNADPQLIERQIYAFELLGILAKSGKEFLFKGGTSLLLLLPQPHRISIDIDILGNFSYEELQNLIPNSVFTRVEEDVRDSRRIPKKHFKFFYNSPLAGERYVLLDILYDKHGFPEVVRNPIRSAFFEVEEELLVSTPTIGGLLGDKLTAFAPNTVGIPAGSDKSMEMIKQVFDIGKLFDACDEITHTIESYRQIQAQESRYRKNTPSNNDSLEDTIQASFLFCQSGYKGSTQHAQIDEMNLGIRQIQSHLLTVPFRADEARVAMAKAAYIATAIMNDKRSIKLNDIRYSPERIEEIRTVTLEGDLTILNRLKATHPEAFDYWWRTTQLL